MPSRFLMPMPLAPATLAVALCALGLAGCASLDTVHSDVSTYGDWPAGRAPGRFVIERLPSQKVDLQRTDLIEAGARVALVQAGFVAADDAASADVVVQIGARITQSGFAPWDDPLWWRWGPSYWHGAGWAGGFGGYGGYGGYGIGRGWVGPGSFARAGYWPLDIDYRYDHEVGLLIRDRASGTPLYEARATDDRSLSGDPAILSTLFVAALHDFPNATPRPHDVAVRMAGAGTGGAEPVNAK